MRKKEPDIYEIMNWCFAKGITIYPVPQVWNGKVLKIAINNNGKETIGSEVYDNGIKIYDKIRELYRTIYYKNNPKNDK